MTKTAAMPMCLTVVRSTGTATKQFETLVFFISEDRGKGSLLLPVSFACRFVESLELCFVEHYCAGAPSLPGRAFLILRKGSWLWHPSSPRLTALRPPLQLTLQGWRIASR